MLDTPIGIVVSGNYAYVASGADDGVEVLDISDPTNPTHVGAITDDGTTELNGAFGIAISGNYVYVASIIDNGVEILDINSMETPSLYAGTVLTDSLSVDQNAQIGQTLTIHGGLNIGSLGFASQGAGSILADGGNTALTIRQSGTGDILNIFDNSTEVLTVLDGGNVGIGTTTPSHPLHVMGTQGATGLRLEASDGQGDTIDMIPGTASSFDRLDFKAGTTDRGVSFMLNPNGTDTRSKISLANVESSTSFGSGFIGTEDDTFNIGTQDIGSPGTSVTDLVFGSYGTLGSGDWTNIVFKGNVGIGTTTPSSVLDIVTSSTDTTAAATEGLEFTVTDTGVVTTGTDALTGLDFDITRTGATGGTINTIGLDLDVTGDTGGTSTLTGLDVNVSGADTNYAAIFQGGNVGIGTSAPETSSHLHLYESTSGGTVEMRLEAAGSGTSQIVFEENAQGDNFIIRYEGADNQFEFTGAEGTIMALGRYTGSMSLGGDTDTIVGGVSNIPNGSLTIEDGALCIDDGGTNCDDASRGAGTVTALGTGDNYFAGDVGIGDASPRSLLTLYGDATDRGTLGLENADTDIQSGEILGLIEFRSNEASTTSPVPTDDIVAQIYAEADAQHTGGNWPTNIIFSNLNSSNVLTERMQIRADGNVGIGTDGPDRLLDILDDTNPQLRLTQTNEVDYADFQVDGSGDLTITPSGADVLIAGDLLPSADDTYDLGGSGSDWGCLYYNGGTLGTCASDRNLKENIQGFSFGDDPLSILESLEVRSFSYRSDDSHSRYHGFIAQEVQDIAPMLVEENNDGYLSVRYGDIQWLLLGSIQQIQSEREEERLSFESRFEGLDLATDENATTISGLRVSVDEQLSVIGDALAVLGTETDALDDRMTALDSRVLASESEIIDLVDTTNELDTRLSDMEEEIVTLRDQTTVLFDFYETFELGGFVSADEFGNVDLLDGKLSAEIVETGGLVIEVRDPDAPTIGTAVITPVTTDEDGIDDETEADGMSVFVPTTAVSDLARIFVTFADDPGASHWVEKTEDDDEYVGFTVRLSEPVAEEVSLDWLIVTEE